MKNNRTDAELNQIIRASMKLEDEPSPELNNTLKAALYRQEAAMRKASATRSLSLWYIPMVLNFILFFMLAAAALVAISNPYLSYLAAGIFLYIGLAGIALTVVGIKRTNMKEDITIHVRKRGVFA